MTVSQFLSFCNSPLYDIEIIDGVNVFFIGKIIDARKEKQLLDKEIEYWEIDDFKHSIIIGVFRE